MAEKPEEKRELTQLVPSRRQLAESVRQTHVVTVEDAKHPEDFLSPEFWALVAKDFVIGDHIELRDDGMTYWAEYLVVACDRTWAKVHPLRQATLTPVEEMPISKDFDVAFKGPHRKWCVIRISDKSIVHEGEQDRTSANRWLEGYAKTVGAPLAKAA